MARATYDSLQLLISQSGGSPFDLSTSIYSKLPYDSASLLSKSSTWQNFETFLSVRCDVTTPSTKDNQENTVENLLSTSTDEGHRHSGTCIALKTYLENVIALKIAHLDIWLPKCMLQTRRHTCVDRFR